MIRRTLGVLALAALGMVLGPPAWARTSFNFDRTKDRSSWFWNRQVDEEVGSPDAPGGVDERVRLQSPQGDDTLPVAITNGDDEKVSAIYFDLSLRGVTAGSTISSFTFRIVEGDGDQDTQKSFNTSGKTILACEITEEWAQGDAEKWEHRPEESDQCAQGERGNGAWTFDVSTIAASWGSDPYGANHGVLLRGKVPTKTPDQTWQINLKIPTDDRKTRDRVKADMAFTPGSSSSTSSSYGSYASSSPSSSFTSPSTSTTGTEATAPPASSPTPGQPVVAAPTAATGPKMPGYVWGLIPLGLLALSAFRTVVLEPAGGPRPDGVIAAIRMRNAARRGVALEESTGLGSRLAAAGRRAVEGVRSVVSKITRRGRS